MVIVRKLVKRFGMKTVLRGLDFEAGKGEFVAILGPNGAGKTTLLRILASLSRPNLGEVSVAGYKLPGQATHVRSRLGVVTHQPLLYGDLSAEENLRFFGQMYGLLNSKIRIKEILGMVGLSMNKDLVRNYSRGMQQRLSIGRAILHDPDVILFDEPHTGLDQDACDMLDKLLKEVASSGRTVIMTSHDLVRVEDLADRFDVLSHGIICSTIKKSDLVKDNLLDYYRKALAN
jgi:heme exporter protein A